MSVSTFQKVCQASNPLLLRGREVVILPAAVDLINSPGGRRAEWVASSVLLRESFQEPPAAVLGRSAGFIHIRRKAETQNSPWL